MAKNEDHGAATGKEAMRAERARRLAEALRENLKRRKAQAKARGTRRKGKDPDDDAATS